MAPMLIAHFPDFDLAGWHRPHFSPRELACRYGGHFCAGEYWHDEGFLDALEALRAAMGQTLAVNSGHRCEQWNVSVGGATNSMHRTIPVDLALAGHDRFALLAAAERLGFTGIGLARMFIPLDRRAAPARWYDMRSAASWQT
jgi:hypothetical protein